MMSADPRFPSGPISWMARNPVAANLMMVILLVGGLIVGRMVKQEVFPATQPDIVQIRVTYRGASPEEVESGILLAAEEAVRGVDGVERVTSKAFEGAALVLVELLTGTDTSRAQADIKNAIDRISSFPEDAESPQVSLVVNRREVISVVVHGEVSEAVLREHADRIRDGLVQLDGVTLAEFVGLKPLEVGVEVPRAKLRAYGLTLGAIADLIGRSAVEVPGGAVRAESGETLLRITERRDRGRDFEDIPIVSRPDGTSVRLGDIATIGDGYAETDQESFFNGEPAVMLRIFRVGDETPIGVADAVKGYVAEAKGALPPGVHLDTWFDWSEMYRERIGLLTRNAVLGFGLVLLILGLFLEPKLAFWVTLGIPVSFLGAMLLVPSMGVTINMVSLFAFIVTLGMVVDDAIVVGENVHEMRQRGTPALHAAVVGARQVSMPVVFAVLTTLAAFSPMLFVPGVSGKLFRMIPIVVGSVLTISLVESLYILPAHLAHSRPASRRGPLGLLARVQGRVAGGLLWFIEHLYRPFLGAALRNRYLTISVGIAILVVSLGFIRGGHIRFSFLPKIDSDRIVASVVMPYGTPVARTKDVQHRIVLAAKEVLDDLGAPEATRGIFAQVGTPFQNQSPMGQAARGTGAHLANVQVFLVPTDKRSFAASEFTRRWLEKTGQVTGVESLTFKYAIGHGGGAPVDVQIRHPDEDQLHEAARRLAAALETFRGAKDVDDGFALGKPQLDFKARPEAASLGLTAALAGRQVRAAFFGVEALRQQRGREELRVLVRLPREERATVHTVETLILRTPAGGEVPLGEAVDLRRGRAYTEITRVDGRRVLDVTADVIESEGNAGEIIAKLKAEILPQLRSEHPGLTWSFEGEGREQRRTVESLKQGFMLALIIIFALLAIPFRSYVQPLVVMAVIPFGIVGALVGHLVMGYGLSIVSMMGIVALAGVVVNDSLVLIDATNIFRKEGYGPAEAITRAGVRRFRPILLTSLTTFFGLMPMILETSVQARFLIPMAISLGFGILFATVIVLVLVPSLYLAVEDIRRLVLGAPSAPSAPPASQVVTLPDPDRCELA